MRPSSFLLRRIASPTFPSVLPLQARGYSTRRQDGKPAPRSRGSMRSPLIGGSPSSTPEQAQSPPQPQPQTQQQQTPPSQRQPAKASPTSATPTPPPPPPPSQAADKPAASSTSESEPAHPYNASNTGNFFGLDLASIIGERSLNYGVNLGQGDPTQRPQIRAKSVSGRTVFIRDRLSPNSAPSPAVALRVLDRMTKQQKIKNKYHSQKFHERKGLKRKRLRSERWRARFKTGFKAAVSRALELKKQGW